MFVRNSRLWKDASGVALATQIHHRWSSPTMVDEYLLETLLGTTSGYLIWARKQSDSLSTAFFSRAFGARESYIATSRGYIDLNGLEVGYETLDSYKTIDSRQLRFEGHGFSSDHNWITWNGNNILWLPVAYRPASLWREATTIFPLSIFIVTTLTNVMIIKFSGPPPP